MFNSEKYPNLVKQHLKIKLNDFSKGLKTFVTENLLPMRYAINTYNFCYNEKGLTDGLGVRPLHVYNGIMEKVMNTPTEADSILGFWVYRQYTENHGLIPLMMGYGSNGKLYFGRITTADHEFRDADITAPELPSCFNYMLNGKNVFLCCSKNKISVFDAIQNREYTENIPSIESAAVHAGRLFATVSEYDNRIYFSDELDPTNWNISDFDGGYIELNDERGKLRQLIESNNYLYVIRDFGISRISAWGLQTDFSVTNMYLSTCKIYTKTAALCGSIIILLCKDGLYYFNGYSMQKITLGFEKLLVGEDNESAVGTFMDGKYYLACRLNFGDNNVVCCETGDYQNNALIEYDINTGEVNILRGVDVCSMAPFQSIWFTKLVVCLRHGRVCELTRDGMANGDPLPKLWSSGYTDLGYPDRKKVLKKLYLNSTTDLTIRVNADGKEYRYQIHGSDLPVEVRLNVSAKMFSITFECTLNNAIISDPQVEVDIC